MSKKEGDEDVGQPTANISVLEVQDNPKVAATPQVVPIAKADASGKLPKKETTKP